VNHIKPGPLKAVLPAEQTAAQAKSELEREGINPDVVVKALQSSTRGRTRSNNLISGVGRKKRETRKTQNSRRTTKKAKTGESTKKKTKPPVNSKRDQPEFNDIFEEK
jgi:hypothetical protein